jgi:hypothetical protein
MLISKVVKVLVVLVFFFWIINSTLNQKKKEQKIQKEGVFICGFVLKKDATKGGQSTLEYSFRYNKNQYSDESYVGGGYYNKKHIGDTIIIKTHKDLLPYTLVCEGLNYKSCFGNQPVNGWKELP